MRKISLSKKDKTLSKKTKIILISLVALFSVAGISILVFLSNYHVYETRIVEPSCERKGYTESTCIYCKKINRTHYTEALGHDYTELKVTKAPTEILFGQEKRECKRCAHTESYSIEPKTNMKKFYYKGDSFQVNSDMTAIGVLTYSVGGKSQEYYIKLKYIDTNRSRYIKHDYRITFYTDNTYSEELEVGFMKNQGIPASSSWELYGNYYDFYNLRDKVATELFCDIRESSKKPLINNNLKNKHSTQISQPILFYLNESFSGVFMLKEPDGDNILNPNSSTDSNTTDQKQAIVRSRYNCNESYFRQVRDPEDSCFSVKYCSTEENDWVYESLNELITFVMENEGDDFKKGISNYLDVDAMIDYMLTVYNTAAADNVARALTLATYDGKIWTPSVYDINASFGMNNDGEVTTLETVMAPSKEKNEKTGEGEPEYIFDSDTNSLLFEKILTCFYDEFKARYLELENKVFTTDYIYEKFERLMNDVPYEAYEQEKEIYSPYYSKEELKDNLTEFFAVRKNIFDVFFDEGENNGH